MEPRPPGLGVHQVTDLLLQHLEEEEVDMNSIMEVEIWEEQVGVEVWVVEGV